jgi:hypothetical protein
MPPGVQRGCFDPGSNAFDPGRPKTLQLTLCGDISEAEKFSDHRYRVGVDIGGTFTDIVFLSRKGDVFRKKVPSTPEDYNKGIVRGIQEVLDENGLTGENIAEVVHGCTVATNAILEHTGALTGLITTKGFRDV